jgi:hypothetical protein
MTVDQRRSRSTVDRVPEALDALERSVANPRLAFERTAGDEFQGLLEGACDVIDAVTVLARLGGWSIGIGAGTVEEPLPTSTREARGPAFLCAREAVEVARRRRPPPLAVRARSVAAAREAEATLRLLLVVLAHRSPRTWEAVDLVRAGATHAEAAPGLGITRQAVSQRLAAAHLDIEDGVRPVVRRLLERADS